MATTKRLPKTSDAAIRAKTGKDWASWFRLLDRAGARKGSHRDIVKLVAQHDVPGWWCQMISVEYELARGLREPHQKSDGFSVSASKTVNASLDALYGAVATATARKRWFPRGTFKQSSATKNKYLNGTWNDARLNIGVYAKGPEKAQIALQVNKLASKSHVDAERLAWKGALARLANHLNPTK